jgi:polyhydroxybutyrate depolymerase
MRLRLVLAGVVLASVACGGSAAPRSSPGRVEDCRGSEAAPGAPPPGPGVSYVNLTVGSQLRDYRVFQPPSIDVTKTVAVVIVLPPPSADADLLESLIHFDTEAATAGFVSVSPNGCGASWPYVQGGSKVADEDFIRKVIGQLKIRYQVSEFFGVSGSGGSRILYRLACDFASDFAGVADIAGTMVLRDGCSPSRPVSILEMHGTADADSPWDGGGPHGSYPVDAVNERWRSLDACTGSPAVVQSGITISSAWTHCSGGAVVRLDKVQGGKHTWFGSGDPDAVPGEPNANAVIWSFFSGLTA